LKHWLFIISGTLLLSSFTLGRVPQRTTSRSLYGNRLDTLSFGERFSLKANAVDWVLLTPSIGVEFTLGNMNWSRWAIGVHGRYKPAVHFDTPPYYSYNLRDFRLDVRRYMHGRNNPRRSWFLGAYGLVGRHDIKLGETGYRGDHLGAGLTAGLIMPLFGYRNGSSLDLELSTSAGVLFVKQDEYTKQDNAVVTLSPASSYALTWKPLLHLAVHDVLRVCLVYHFGPSVADRYKRRIAIDERYRQHLNELKMRRDSTRQAHQEQRAARRDSLEKADYEYRFEKQHQALERAFMKDSLQKARKVEKALARQARRAERDSIRQAKKVARELKRQARQAARDSVRQVRAEARKQKQQKKK